MKKSIIAITAMCIMMCFCSCTGQKAIDNEEITRYLPVLREDYPMIIEKLETLRLGVCGENKYIVIKNRTKGISAYEMVFWKNNRSYSLEETPDVFPQNEIDAINYLFFSDELQQNAMSINYDDAYWYAAIDSQGAQFASTKDIKWNIGIYHFEDNKMPDELQEKEVYTEELADFYWIVIFNMRRDKL